VSSGEGLGEAEGGEVGFFFEGMGDPRDKLDDGTLAQFFEIGGSDSEDSRNQVLAADDIVWGEVCVRVDVEQGVLDFAADEPITTDGMGEGEAEFCAFSVCFAVLFGDEGDSGAEGGIGGGELVAGGGDGGLERGYG